MILSVVIPAHNEEEAVRPTVERLYGTLMEAGIPCEILVVNDHSTDRTEEVLQSLSRELPGVRYVNNPKAGGFGRAIQTGLERFRGDAVCIVMADASDDPQDVVAYYHKLEEGYDCVFGSRFISGGRVVDYPVHKLYVNRLANYFIDVLFRLRFNDTTNAFKAYRREVIDGVQPLLSPHFNITVELPLKAITRGFSYTVVPINWYNRATGVSKLKIKEMGSRYLFIVLYVWLEKLLSRGDYRRKLSTDTAARLRAAEAHSDDERDALMVATLRRPAVASASGVASLTRAATVAAPARVAAPEATPAPLDSSPLPERLTSLRPTLSALAGALSVLPLLLIGFILTLIWTRTPHVPYWDEWETVTLMRHFTSGTLTWNDFWAFHNEHRIVIPQILDVGLIAATHWNRQIEMTFDLLLAVAEYALLIVSAYRGLRSKLLTALAAAPMGLAVFSLAQYEDWLWSFQITFFCTVLGVALCMWGLTKPRVGWGAFAVTIVGAVIAALSSLGGLAVFVAFMPAVLRLGYKKTIAWLVVAVGVIVPYMQGFPHSVPVHITLKTFEFIITYLGTPVGTPSAKVAFGGGLLSLALVVANLAYYWMRERRIAPLLPWIGLGGYAIGLALITALGRIDLTIWSEVALTSRYQIFSALWWLAVIYLLVYNARSALGRLGQRDNASPKSTPEAERLTLASGWLAGANVAMMALLTLGMVVVSARSVSNAASFQNEKLQAEACVVNEDYSTVPCLWGFYPAPNVLQQDVKYLRSQGYTIFGENAQALERPAPDPAVHALYRYYDPENGDYLDTTAYDVYFYGPFRADRQLGYLYDTQQPGTHALYGCASSDGYHFVALKADCDGGSFVRIEGWLLDKPLPSATATPLYTCERGNVHFIASDMTCENKVTTPGSPLGYALAAPK